MSSNFIKMYNIFNGLHCLLVTIILYFLNLGIYAQILELYEGEICRKGDGNSSNYICRRIHDCTIVRQGIKNNIIPQLCSFDKSTPIVCCPPTDNVTVTTLNMSTVEHNSSAHGAQVVKTYSATEMCHEYSQLIYTFIKDPTLISNQDKYIKVKDCLNVITLIVNGTKAEPKEFPHMALLGYSEKPENNRWACGGSLISKRWILTAAHCEKIGSSAYALWARLGDLNYLSTTDDARPKDYKIVKRIIHPNYRPPTLYNDIALFCLEKDVEFSAYVRPICLNTDKLLKPSSAIATGWGQIEFGGAVSPDLLKVVLNTIAANQCNKSYSSNFGKQLPQGIIDDSMICAGFPQGGKDTCGGDSGGPIQIKNHNYTCMYTQIGVTSFGKFCAEKDSPGVYTRVSKYISWIEQIVWPKIK